MFGVGPFSFESSATADYVNRRLRGTIWQNIGLAHTLYGSCLALGKWLGDRGVSPNALTYASLFVAALAGIGAGLGYFAAAALLLALSGVCDILDGAVARASG